jgi:hypothetical protein
VTIAGHDRGVKNGSGDIQMWRFLSGLIVLLALPAAVRAEQPVGTPDVHVGDRWTFQQRDGLTDDVQGEFTRRVVTVSSTEITAVQQVKGRPGQTVSYFSREWNLEDNGTTKFDPPAMVLHLPMKTGDAWQNQYKARTLANGFTMSCHVSSKVVARDTVAVPAGSFDALRIESRSECQNASGNSPSVLFANSNWYAPSAKAIVKTIASSIFEGRERSKTVTEMLNFSLADRAEPAPGQVPPGQVPPGLAPSGKGPAIPSASPSAVPEKGI